MRASGWENNDILQGAARLGAFALAALLAFAAFACALAVPQRAYAAADQPSRAIAIGYDNSGSMVKNQSKKWCAAKYSLEVLASMLDEGDSMALYTMDDGSHPKLEVNGAQAAAQRVAAVHDADLQIVKYTDTCAAAGALNYLNASGAQSKYLIITTDGEFNQVNGDSKVGEDGARADAARIVEEAAAKGITVVYFVMDIDDAKLWAVDENPSRNIFVERPTSVESILPSMVSVANRVFGRDALPAEAVDAGSGALDFDVPMSKIIVFAQGEDVQVGDLTTSAGEVISGDSSKVRYSDEPSKTYVDESYRDYGVETSFQGVVCTYEGDIPRGGAQIDVGGASNVEVYYTPRVGIALDLKDTETNYACHLKPGEETELSAGTYDVEMYFVDPGSEGNERLESALLKEPQFSLEARVGGSLQSIQPGEQLKVSPGQVDIRAAATTNGTVHVEESYDGISVTQAAKPLVVDASAIPSALDLGGFGAESYPVTVKKDDGTPFSDEEWAGLEFTVEDDKGIEWDVEKADEAGVVHVRPQLVDDDTWATQQKLFGGLPLDATTATLDLSASCESGDKIYRGGTEHTIAYAGDWKEALLHAIPFIIGFLLLLFLLFMYLRKPRLPRKMRPHLVIASQDEPVALSYSEQKIQNKYSPFGPETVVFNAHSPRDSMDAQALRLTERYELGRIGLVAAKKENGKRRFKLDQQTLTDMRRHMDEAAAREESRTAGFPDPDYNPRPAKSFKDQKSSRSISSTIMFTGYNVPPRGKKRQEETYTIYFKKPN